MSSSFNVMLELLKPLYVGIRVNITFENCKNKQNNI